MKYFYLIIATFILSACSIQGMVEKAVPENVRANHNAHIDTLLAKDKQKLIKLFEAGEGNQEATNKLTLVLENIPDGKEIRRDYVGMNSSSKFSHEGNSRYIHLITEVETETGFMTVTSQYALDSDGTCCALTNINVVASETSPVRAALEIARIVGIISLTLILGLIALAIFRSRRRVHMS